MGRIVIVDDETYQAELMRDILKMYFSEHEVVQLSASRSKEIGRYHLMMGENPIYIITCQYPREIPSKSDEER